MARKGKGFDVKGMFVNHGEKMVFVIILGLVVFALTGTSWVPYGREPGEFTTKVEQAKETIAKTTWSQEDKDKFLLEEESLPRRIVDAGIHERIQVTPMYLQSQPQVKNKDAQDEPLQEPEFLAVADLEVSSSRVLIRQLPKYDESTEGTDGEKTDGSASESEGTEAEEDVPDELRSPGSGGFPAAGFPGAAGATMNPAAMGIPSGMFGRGRMEDRDYGSMIAPELMMGRGGMGAMAGPGAGRAGAGRGAARGAGRGNAGGRVADVDTTPGRTGRRGRSAGRRGRAEDDIATVVAGPGGATAAGDEVLGTGMGYYGGTNVKGKGYPFVSVRGVFEFREQIRKYSEAIHKGHAEALQHFMIIDFNLERQRLIRAPDQWTDWEPVNDQVFRDILKEADGFDPEVVQAAVTDSAITCPLPARLSGAYRDAATHKRLEKYKLSESEMQKELEYNRLILEKVLEQNKPLEGAISKRGFNDMVFDARSVAQGIFGGASPYGGFMGSGNRLADGDEDMPDMMSGRMMGRGGPGAIGMAGRGMQNSQMTKTIQQIAQELAKRTADAKSEDATKELIKFIEQRVVPEGDLLLFRYFDFDIEPGETYRYRVRLVLQNPNYGAPLAATGGVASVREGAERVTPWSEPTPPVKVEETVQYFLTGVQPPKALVYPEARMNVFQYDQDVGTVVQRELDVSFGQNIGGKARLEQADPAKGTIEEVDFTFKSEDVLLDAIGDLRLAKSDHPDLQLPADSRGLSQMPEFAAVVTPRGQIETIDQMTQAAGLARAKKYMEKQEEYYAHLRGPDTGAADEYGGLYNYGGDGDEDLMAVDPVMMMGRNPLRKGGRGGAGRH